MTHPALGSDARARQKVGPFPDAVAYDTAKGELFVVTPDSNATSIISDTTDTVVATKGAGPGPFDIAYDPAKGELFVTNPNADTLTIISDASATATSSSSATSTKSAFPPSFLTVLAANALVLVVLGALASKRRSRRTQTALA